MAEQSYGFSKRDAGRIGRSVLETEGIEERPTRQRAKYPVGMSGPSLKPFLIITDMKPYPDPDYTFAADLPLKYNFDNRTNVAASRTPNRRRLFHCWASAMDMLTDESADGEYVFCVRFTDDAPTTLQWRFRRGSQYVSTFYNQVLGAQATPTATQMLAAMQSMSAWAGNVETFGYGDYYTAGSGTVRFGRKAWYIKFAGTVPAAMHDGLNTPTYNPTTGLYYNTFSNTIDAGFQSPYFGVYDATTSAASAYIDYFQDYFWPNGRTSMLFSGSPSQEQLKSGAVVWAMKYQGRWIVPGNECWTYTPT